MSQGEQAFVTLSYQVSRVSGLRCQQTYRLQILSFDIFSFKLKLKLLSHIFSSFNQNE